jgi:ribose 1,5-bisphosphokinase PhnN
LTLTSPIPSSWYRWGYAYASRRILAEVRARYANVDTVLVTAPAEVLAARLSARSRDTDGSYVDRVKRSDNFVEFRADHVIENTGAIRASVWRAAQYHSSAPEGGLSPRLAALVYKLI